MNGPDPEAALRAALARRREARRARDREVVRTIRQVAEKAEQTARVEHLPEERREALRERAREFRELANEAAEVAGLEDDDHEGDDDLR